MSKILRVVAVCGVLSLVFLMLNGCEGWFFERPAFGQFEAHKKPLRVVVVAQPLTYQKLRGLQSGYEFDLLQQFAQDYDYTLSVRTLPNATDVMTEVAAGRADVGAARLPSLWLNQTSLEKGPVYDEQKIALVCRRNISIDFSLMGRMRLEQPLRVVTSSKTISREWVNNFEHETPLAHIQVLPQPKASVLFNSLRTGQNDCLLLDRLEVQYHLRSYPELHWVKDLRAYQQYQFVLASDRDDVKQDLRFWFPRAARSGSLHQIRDRYKNYLDELKLNDQTDFLKFFAERFQPYEKAIKKYSFRNNIPWQLVAAVAFQESHLDPEAQSWTGVRGLMQLTEETAEHVGIDDRKDPEQSILGGSKYLHMLLERQPKNISDRERLALALATYNVGPAHMIDAQNLAVRLGKNPNSWKDMRTVLPKLSDPFYSSMLKYGAARGEEPVEFVDRVFSYIDMIQISSVSRKVGHSALHPSKNHRQLVSQQ
jgi:membrane-bound lytic murein transglycosylase F